MSQLAVGVILMNVQFAHKSVPNGRVDQRNMWQPWEQVTDLMTLAALLLAARWQFTKHRDSGPSENEMPTPPLLPEIQQTKATVLNTWKVLWVRKTNGMFFEVISILNLKVQNRDIPFQHILNQWIVVFRRSDWLGISSGRGDSLGTRLLGTQALSVKSYQEHWLCRSWQWTVGHVKSCAWDPD